MTDKQYNNLQEGLSSIRCDLHEINGFLIKDLPKKLSNNNSILRKIEGFLIIIVILHILKFIF